MFLPDPASLSRIILIPTFTDSGCLSSVQQDGYSPVQLPLLYNNYAVSWVNVTCDDRIVRDNISTSTHAIVLVCLYAWQCKLD
jgi:hypothetical protein